MRDVRLVGLSEDGTQILLQLPDGERVSLALDERVQAATRGDRTRLGQLQIELESRLSPKEIQARIRAGRSAEQVAEEAGIPVERVIRFAGPILHEREHMAEEARISGVVRRSEIGGAVTLLGELVSDRLEERGIPREALIWDSWRREDDAWEVRLAYVFDGEDHSALWVYDPLRRAVLPDDDEARWLTGEIAQAPPSPTGNGAKPRKRALRAVEGTSSTSTTRATQSTPSTPIAPPAPSAPSAPSAPGKAAKAPAKPAAVTGSAPKRAAADAEETPKPAKRASVPSWDEIVFGTRKPD